MGLHAKLSPSAADRWTVCTAAPEATADLAEKSSPYAQEGTEAHDLLEKCVKAALSPIVVSPGHPAVEAVTVAYDLVAPFIIDPKVVVLSETKVTLTEECWGTADLIVLLPTGEMQVIDYKHGQGVLVEPDSKQLLIYAAAALKDLEWMAPAPIKTVTTVIVQPRAAHSEGIIRVHTRERVKLLEEAGEIIHVIDQIKSGRTEFIPSAKGCKFCKLAGSCKPLADLAMQEVHAYFKPTGFVEVPSVTQAQQLTVEQKGAILEARGLFKTFLAAIEADVESTLLAGGAVPGFKVVAGRSNRCFDKSLSSDDVLNILTKELKFKVSDVAPPKLLGPAPIEKMLDTKKRNGKAKMERLQSIIVKPEGKPTIVSEDDKRPAISCEFKEITSPLS